MTTVIDRRTTPEGVVPAHLPQWVVMAIAAGMIAILTFTGARPGPRSSTPSVSASVTDASQQRIEEYERRVQEQSQRLAAEQAELQLAKHALADRSTTAESTSPQEAVPDRPRARVAAVAPGPAAATAPNSAPTTDGSSRVSDSVAFSRQTSAARASGASTPAALPPAAERLLEGTVIETVLINRIDGTFAGPVICMVTTPVYAPQAQRVVIPPGSRVLGEARPVSAFGQTRLAIAFHRLVLPNGTRVDLDGFHGLDQSGSVGIQDQVDRHYAQIFGASLAIGAIAGLAEVRTGGPNSFDTTSLDAYRQGVAASLAQSSTRVLDRFLNILPTVTIREGHRIKVFLSNDLEVPAVAEVHR